MARAKKRPDPPRAAAEPRTAGVAGVSTEQRGGTGFASVSASQRGGAGFASGCHAATKRPRLLAAAVVLELAWLATLGYMALHAVGR